MIREIRKLFWWNPLEFLFFYLMFRLPNLKNNNIITFLMINSLILRILFQKSHFLI